MTARVSAPLLPLSGLAACLASAGMTWDKAAGALWISPATLRSYAYRGAPLAMITALTLLLNLPNHSPRPLFVRPTEGLKTRTALEPHRTRLHQPTLPRAVEQQLHAIDPFADEMVGASRDTAKAGATVWEQLSLTIAAA